MQTERTILSALTKGDFIEVLRMYEEQDTFKYIEPLQNKTADEYKAFLNSRIAQVNTKTGYHWAVRLIDNNKFIGTANLNPIRGTDKMQIGFQLRRKYWNQGYATELTKRILEFAIKDARLRVIYGVFDKRNVASRKIFSKLGFEFEEGRTMEGEEFPIEIWKYIVFNNK